MTGWVTLHMLHFWCPSSKAAAAAAGLPDSLEQPWIGYNRFHLCPCTFQWARGTLWTSCIKANVVGPDSLVWGKRRGALCPYLLRVLLNSELWKLSPKRLKPTTLKEPLIAGVRDGPICYAVTVIAIARHFGTMCKSSAKRPPLCTTT